MQNATLKFVRLEWRFLLFGFLLSFWSSPGQTFVISLFGEEIRTDFNLTHGEFGTIYTLATLTSAAILWKTGPLVDKLPLKRFVTQMLLLMILATALFSGIQGPITLYFGILFVRFMGQGMLNHIAFTAMGRRYVHERGRALAVVGLGFSVGESIFPPAIVLALAHYDWRYIWPTMAILAAVIFLPFIGKLISHTEQQDGPGALATSDDNDDEDHWTRDELLRDRRFYLLALIPIAQSGIITGVFFHQVHIIDLKSWSLEWWSICFSIFAAFALLGSVASGFLVDRFSARKIAPYSLTFMIAALLFLSFADHWVFAAILMALLGFGAGYTGPALSALWPELYGTRHLGAIRSVANVVMVFGSALGPVFMGIAFDQQIALETILLTSMVIAAGAITAAKIALKQ